jgi:hypothetical protein
MPGPLPAGKSVPSKLTILKGCYRVGLKNAPVHTIATGLLVRQEPAVSAAEFSEW